MNYQRNQVVEIETSRLVPGGAALGHLSDKRPIFVRGGAPNELAEVRLTRIKKDFAEGEFLRAIRPSPERTPPPFARGALGGADWAHLRYETQLAAKEGILRTVLERIGHLPDLSIEAMVPSPTLWRYRNKIELTFGLDTHGKVALGFHVRGRFDEVLPTDDVAFFPEVIKPIIAAVTNWANRENLTVYEPRRNQGLLRNLVVRRAEHGSDLVLNLVTAPGTIPESSLLISVNSLPITGLVWSQNSSPAMIVRVDVQEILSGSDRLTETFCGVPIEYGIDSFFQTNTVMAEKLTETLLNRFIAVRTTSGIQHLVLNTRGCTDLEGVTLIDGYAGVGGFGLLAARLLGRRAGRGVRVISIESHPASSADAQANARRLGVANRMTFINLPMETFLSSPDTKYEIQNTVLIVDPPRAGLHPKATQAILASAIKTIFYVSCNPATLARDLQILSYSYRPVFIQPFDLFPQTSHLETLVQLTQKTVL